MQVNSEFHAFKHFEALGPGELQRAVAPLEAALALHPTLLLTNALPAAMDVIIWQACGLRLLLCSALSPLRHQHCTFASAIPSN